MNVTQPEAYDLNQVITWLESKNYKITRPFIERTSYSNETPPGRLLKAAILDTETTGTNQATDKIIDLGIVIVEYSPESGQVYRVLETFNELEYPGMPIPPESTKIHGITDDMVQGKRINDDAVAALMADVSLVIAHNAFFDRGFVESRLPLFQKNHGHALMPKFHGETKAWAVQALSFWHTVADFIMQGIGHPWTAMHYLRSCNLIYRYPE